jgi:uridine kinase
VSYVISISAPVGGGKSSLAQGLAQNVDDAAAIYFDHYETLTERDTVDIKRWMRDGADIDQLVIEHLPEHLARLKQGEPVVDPTGLEIGAARYIFFETPFARRHRATGALIDLSIWIDTPLDVALARNLREFARRPDMRAGLADWLGPYLDSYLDFVRELLLLQRDTVGAAADLVLDGLEPLEVNVARAQREILATLR